MITVRKSEERRHIADGDQKTWMTFDWENKADPLQNGFGALKILNEEVLSPGRAFILHTHKDMVIVTYVHDGVIIYNDPLEKSGLLEPGDYHQIHVAAGAKQYAVDASPSGDAHVFQSGFTPGVGVLDPGGEKKHFTLAERKGILRLIASPDGKEASLKIKQDVQMYSTLIHKGNHMIHELKPGRNAWLHVVKGRILTNEIYLQMGDGAGFSDVGSVSFTAQEPTEILLFDLA
jgi:quercetin 2,3-dioxygenase